MSSADEVVDLLTELVALNSTNPQLSPGGPGEGAVADLIGARLTAAGLAVERYDVAPGRPNVVATLRGNGTGPTLMLCGHTDVVGGTAEQFRPTVRDGRLYGRGAYDMKGGLAAAVIAVERLARASQPLPGAVVLAAVCDEEWRSAGAEALVARHRADAAILPEPSNLDLVVEHGGFSWHEVVATGVQAAGGDTENGRDAISALGPVLTAIAHLDRELARRPAASYGRGSIHASTIAGGDGLPVYPASCRLGVERCLIGGESWRGAEAELQAMIAAARAGDPDAQLEARTIVGRDPVELGPDEPVVEHLHAAAAARLGREPGKRGEIGWCDSGLLVAAGIPCVVFGPQGAGEHTDCEWVDLASVAACADILEHAARSYLSIEAGHRP